MKKKLCVLAAFTLVAATVFAQQVFDYLKDSLDNVLEMSATIRITDYEYKDGGALWGTYLEPGKTLSSSSQFDGGVEYIIIAAAHSTRINVDLKVYEGNGTNGTVVFRDIAPDATPVARFTPETSGLYSFELINSSNSPAFISLIVLKHKRNANFTLSALTQAVNNIPYLADAISRMLPPGAEIPANKWTLFGGSVNRGTYTRNYNVQLSRGAYFLTGAGENSVNNLDAEVIEQRAENIQEGRIISTNSGKSSLIDYGTFEPNSSRYYNLKIINISSARSSAFMFGFLILTVKY